MSAELSPDQRGLIELRSLDTGISLDILNYGVEKATEMGVSGFMVVYSRTGMQECSLAVGTMARPMHAQVALLKIKTVLATRCSTSVQKQKMEDAGQRLEDFGDILGTTIPGGVAVFSDKEAADFVGAIAFSGGKPEQDEVICREAVDIAGFYSDLSAKSDRETEFKFFNSGAQYIPAERVQELLNNPVSAQLRLSIPFEVLQQIMAITPEEAIAASETVIEVGKHIIDLNDDPSYPAVVKDSKVISTIERHGRDTDIWRMIAGEMTFGVGTKADGLKTMDMDEHTAAILINGEYINLLPNDVLIIPAGLWHNHASATTGIALASKYRVYLA